MESSKFARACASKSNFLKSGGKGYLCTDCCTHPLPDRMDSVMESPSVPRDVSDINVCLLSAKKKSASSPSLRDLDQMSLW